MKPTIIGSAFEQWTFDVLKPYIKKLGATKWNGNPDFYFDLNNHVILLECKCFQFRDGQKGRQSKPGYLCLGDSQIKSLKKMKNGLGGDNEIYLVVGISFDNYDIIPVVVELEEALRHAMKWKDGLKRKWISMNWLIKQKPFRTWIGEVFKVEPKDIVFPEFRSYLK